LVAMVIPLSIPYSDFLWTRKYKQSTQERLKS
jgi:hypothetical protein